VLYNPHRFLAVPTEEPTTTTMVPTTTLLEDDITTTTEEEEEGEDKTVRPLEDGAEQDGEFVFTSLPPGRV
jgi:hypothetical protein